MSKNKAFTLVEILMASTLTGVALLFMLQFFLTHMNQYYWIVGSNQLCEDLRTFAKFLEKDVHNSLEFYVFENLNGAMDFSRKITTTNKSPLITLPTVGNCALLVQEKGMVSGGKGIVYYIGTATSERGTNYLPLYRARVEFNNDGKISTTTEDLAPFLVAKLKVTDDGKIYKAYTLSDKKGIFYMHDRRGSYHQHHFAGVRHGFYVNSVIVEPGMHFKVAETPCNFCFYSRNPRFSMHFLE